MKGIQMQVSTVFVSFTIQMPLYMNFSSYKETEYFGWNMFIYADSARKHRFIRCTKELPVMEASIQAIWFRSELQSAFTQFSPRKPYKPKSLIGKRNDWLSTNVKDILQTEKKYLLNAQ